MKNNLRIDFLKLQHLYMIATKSKKKDTSK